MTRIIVDPAQLDPTKVSILCHVCALLRGTPRWFQVDDDDDSHDKHANAFEPVGGHFRQVTPSECDAECAQDRMIQVANAHAATHTQEEQNDAARLKAAEFARAGDQASEEALLSSIKVGNVGFPEA